MIVINRPSEKDASKIAKISLEIFEVNKDYDPFYKNDWVVEDMTKYFVKIIKSKRIILCAYKDKKLVGYLCAGSKKDDNRVGKCLEIVELGVVSSYRNRGVGRMLINECLVKAKVKKYDRVFVNCYSRNNEAIDFYYNLGFKEIDVSLEINLT